MKPKTSNAIFKLHRAHASVNCRRVGCACRAVAQALESRTLLSVAGPGSLDPAFGTDGSVITTFGDVKDSAHLHAMTLQADGRILATGNAAQGHPPYTPVQDFPLVRYNTNGTLDSTFGQGGIALLPVPSGGEALAVQPDGRILVAALGEDFVLLRTTTSGSLDPSFGNGGQVLTDFGGNDAAEAMALQPDGRIIVAGNTDGRSVALARYLPTGALDPSFGIGGKAVVTPPTTYARVCGLALQDDGKIDMVINDFVDHGYVLRLNANGSPDTSFGAAGFADPGFYARALALLRNGDILVGGSATIDENTRVAALAYYTPSGEIDATCGTAGQVRTTFAYTSTGTRAEDAITSIAQQRDDKIVVSANVFRNTFIPDGHAYWGLARYTPAGMPDLSFGSGGVTIGFDYSGMYASNNVDAVALQTDGKIVVAGGPLFGGLSVSSGSFRVARYLGDPPAWITGTVFFDADADGYRDDNETGIMGRTVYVDLNRNGRPDSGEPGDTTAGPGGFQIGNLAPGMDYVVRQILPFGWRQTSPKNDAGVHVDLTSGQGTSVQFGATGPIAYSWEPVVPAQTIYADLYDIGFDGVAYHDTTPESLGAPFRPDGVDFNAFGANGHSVGYTAPGEWLGYTIEVSDAGNYMLLAHVANLLQGGSFHVDIDGVDVTGAITVPDTGGWSDFTDINSKPFDLPYGRHFMQVFMDKAGYWGNIANFDYFKIIPPTPRPYYGGPFNVNTDTIHAVAFDRGGEGVAYHDTTPQNIGGQFRPDEAVDINKGGTNGFSVGYTAPGEWLTYSVQAPAPGYFSLRSTVANYKPGGTFHVEMDGVDVTGEMTVPDTGPWDTWTTLTSKPFFLTAGNHLMRVVMDQPGYWGNVGDFDTFKFIQGAGPYKGNAFNINTDTIEAEDFDNGGEGLGYHDTTPGNQTGLYRTSEGVDINKGGTNGYSVGYTAPGEWLTYSITAPAQETYTLQATVANLKPGGKFHIEIDGQAVTGALSVPDTGGWFNWQTVSSPTFTVFPGDHILKVVLDTAGYWGNVGNFDSFKFKKGPGPFKGVPFNIYAHTIEAEDFNNGGQNFGYFDTTPGNQTGLYRPDESVDINNGGSNSFSVGYTAPTEWLEYSIIAPAGSYVLQSRVANYLQGGSFHLEIDYADKTGWITVPDTGGWFNWTTLSSAPFTVSDGHHDMRIRMDAAGYWGNVANFDYFKFVPAP